MSSMKVVSERQVGTLTLETQVYEDGYISVTLLDDFGAFIAELDGHVHSGQTASIIESYLLDQRAQ